jgi:hypothetical protein
MRGFPAVVAGTALLAACAGAPRHHPQAPDISGRWIDEHCQSRPTQYALKNIFLRREFTFAQASGDWGVDARFYEDSACTRPVFTLVVRGKYEITGPASGLPGVFDGRFGFSRRAVIAWSEPAVKAFREAKCGPVAAQPGLELDTSTTGCAPALSRPISPEAAAEYDLVQFDGTRLAFGVRTPEMTKPEGRPTKPSPFGLVRK